MSDYKIPTESEIKSEISRAESQVASSNSATTNSGSSTSASTATTVAQVDEYCYGDIVDAIDECDDVVSALECVGAMYGIPAENILCDTNAKSIRVMGDNIIAPPSNNVSGNAKAIVCAIGAVLDNISQRIDQKLDAYQVSNIAEGKRNATRREANPAKGNVVGRYNDDNGDEIIVYDTGMVDMAHTQEAIRKVDELRQDMKIPMYKPNAMRVPQYFTASDGLTNGVDMKAGDLEIPKDLSENKVDVASDIQESAFFIDLMSKYNDTSTLGYNLFSSIGFGYVKPNIMPITVQESGDEKDSKKSKDVSVSDIKYLKFDNTHILNAIKYFNKARADQSVNERGKINKESLVRNPNFTKGVDELSKQFDARINIRIAPDKHSNATTIPNFLNEYKTKLHISKSKGFQLNGLCIDIFWMGNGPDDFTPDDDELFGQSFVAICLHEIFHNIMDVIRCDNAQRIGMLQSTLMIASSIRDGKKKRVFLTNYVNTLSDINGKKLNRLEKRVMVKRLAMLTSLNLNGSNMNTIVKKLAGESGNSSNEASIDEIIKLYEKVNKKLNREKSYKSSLIYLTLAAVAAISGFIATGNPLGSALGGIFLIKAAFSALSTAAIRAVLKAYRSEQETEEYYCDLFCGMYKLPQRFYLDMGMTSGTPKLHANHATPEQLQKLVTLEREIGESVFSIYPSAMERNWAGVKIAKHVLETDKDLDPAIKKYCQWIVDNYSKTLDTDIEEIYSTATFDPRSAADLDAHLNKLITTNNITVTESFIHDMLDTKDMMVQESYRDYLDSELFMEADNNKDGKQTKSILTRLKNLMLSFIRTIRKGFDKIMQMIRKRRETKGSVVYYNCPISKFDLEDMITDYMNMDNQVVQYLGTFKDILSELDKAVTDDMITDKATASKLTTLFDNFKTKISNFAKQNETIVSKYDNLIKQSKQTFRISAKEFSKLHDDKLQSMTGNRTSENSISEVNEMFGQILAKPSCQRISEMNNLAKSIIETSNTLPEMISGTQKICKMLVELLGEMSQDYKDAHGTRIS